MPARFRSMPAALAVLAAVVPAMTARAQTAGTGCSELAARYDEAIRTADGLVMAAVEHALKASDTSGALKQLGLGGQGVSPEQAVRRGALAALPPTTQGAVAIYLLRANTAMQALVWKGCPPPGGQN
ncbi:hypothetical protein GCM10009416_00370 [Craurococcus roseus]|uniref:Uncharacterized protein n=1 Tax=Craurococcus roseus TaxID=77585 RepID=A0ABP3PK69_9PROT